jgi:hypothetical protein
MLDREIKREISPSELTLLINEEFQNTSPALLDEWVIKLLAEPKNHPSVRTAFQELWNEKEEPSIYFLKVMAIIHNSPFKDLCLQYSKDGKFGTQEMGIHEMGNIMTNYRQLTQQI